MLFDRAIKNIEHGDYEAARLTLNTLINTYDTSEFLAKAKLAIADSWFREGGAHGLAQAEAEYKDFILFYPNMEEAAESQYKICNIHYKQMEKADRDNAQGQRAEDECRQVMVAVPEFEVRPAGAADAARHAGSAGRQGIQDRRCSITSKGSFPAAANRLAFRDAAVSALQRRGRSAVANWRTPTSTWATASRISEADALTELVRDYPLSSHT